MTIFPPVCQSPPKSRYNDLVHASPLFRPPLHGAVGPWDEIVSLIPVVIGAVVLLYLYFSSRRPADGDDDANPSEAEADREQSVPNR